METFINHSNPEISSIVTSILMDDEKYTLSDWKRKNIFVTESVEVLSKLVSDAILNLSNNKTLDQISVGRLEDLDVPKTVVSLQKSNYIQTVATAMLKRVKSTMEAVLQILER